MRKQRNKGKHVPHRLVGAADSRTMCVCVCVCMHVCGDGTRTCGCGHARKVSWKLRSPLQPQRRRRKPEECHLVLSSNKGIDCGPVARRAPLYRATLGGGPRTRSCARWPWLAPVRLALPQTCDHPASTALRCAACLRHSRSRVARAVPFSALPCVSPRPSSVPFTPSAAPLGPRYERSCGRHRRVLQQNDRHEL